MSAETGPSTKGLLGEHSHNWKVRLTAIRKINVNVQRFMKQMLGSRWSRGHPRGSADSVTYLLLWSDDQHSGEWEGHAHGGIAAVELGRGLGLMSRSLRLCGP